MKEKKSIYEQILAKGKEALKSVNDVIAKKRDKRAFKSAYDNALENRDAATQKRLALYEEIGKYGDNMDKIIASFADERQAQLTMDFIKEQYEEVFGEEMNENE